MVTKREICSTRSGRPLNRSLKFLKCWRASSVVGCEDRHLLAGHGGDERGPERHLGLAEADIAADQPVHGLARAQIVQHGVDGAELVLGLLEREAGGELVVEARRQLEPLPPAQLAGGRDLDQLVGQLLDPLLDPGLAVLPADAAQLVELHFLVRIAVARQDVEVLDRHEELVAAGIEQLQAVVGRAAELERDEAVETADAVLGMDDEIAFAERAHILDELVGGLGPARLAAGQPLAQQVLLADQAEPRGQGTGLERQHGQVHGTLDQLVQPLDAQGRLEVVIDQHLGQPVRGTAAIDRDDRALAFGLERVQVLGDRLEQVDLPIGALEREIAAGAALEVDDPGDARRRHGRGLEDRAEPGGVALQQRVDGLLVEIERVRRQGAVGQGAKGAGDRSTAGPHLVLLADRCLAGGHRVHGQVVEADLDRPVEVVEDGCQLVVEQRQPVLHARVVAAGGDGFEQRVVGDGAELAKIAGAKALARGRIEQHLAHRAELDRGEPVGGALGCRIEAADRFQRGAEEVEAHRLAAAGGKEIDQPAAHRIIAGLDHGADALVAIALEMLDQRVPVDLAAGLEEEVAGAHRVGRRQLLHQRVGGNEDEAGLRRGSFGQPVQRGEALGHDAGIGRDPVIGQAVPGRQRQHLDVGREEADELGQRRASLGVAGHVQEG